MKTELVSRTAELYKSQITPKAKATEVTSTVKKSDSVEISSAGLSRQKEAETQVSGYDKERADRLQSIKDRVSHSVYRLDNQALETLADRILDIV